VGQDIILRRLWFTILGSPAKECPAVSSGDEARVRFTFPRGISSSLS
jgi:hypothetical protein